MKQIIIMRETLIKAYKHYEGLILFVLKLITGMVIFNMISGIGQPSELFESLSQPPMDAPFRTLLAILFTILPPTAGYGLITLHIGIQFSGNLGANIFIMIFLLCLIFFYVRLAPKESGFIIATFFGFYLGLPYIVPLIGGLYFGFKVIIPITIGVFIWEFAPVAQEFIAGEGIEGAGLTELPGIFSEMYKDLLASVLGSHQWIFTAFVFAMVVAAVFLISRASIDYAKDIAIGAGIIMNLFGFMIAVSVTELNTPMLGVFILTLISALFTWCVRFFDVALDYKRTERVQFEDDDYYYYVKAVPKIASDNRPRRLQPQPAADYDYREE